MEGSESPAPGPGDRLLQSSESHQHGESSGKGRAAWHAVFNPDRPQNQVQHVRSASLKGRRGEQRSRSSSPETGVGSGTKGSSATKGRPFAKPISRALNMSVTQKVVGCLRSNVLTILNIAGVFSGVVLALALRSSREEKWTQREIVYVGFVGDLFLRMLKCLILPLIVSSMISAVGSLDLSVSGRIGTRAIVYYMTTTVSAVILGIILVLTIHPGEGSDKGIVRGGSVRHVTTADMLMDLIRNLFPPNLVQACTAQYKTVLTPPADYLESLANMTNSNGTDAGNMTAGKPKNLYDWKMSSDYEDATNILGLVVFSTVLGITLGRMGAKGKPLLNFFVSMSEAVMMITGWVVWLSPVGVMFLVASKMLEMESWEVMLGQLGMYFFTVMIGLFIHGFVVLQLIYFIVTRKLPFRYVGNLSEALATAFATSSRSVNNSWNKSVESERERGREKTFYWNGEDDGAMCFVSLDSSATLPVALKCLEEKNQVDPRVTRFVMPIGATINMDGTALYEAVAAIFISQVRGIHLTMGNVVAVSITATAASIGAAGIPQAGIVTMVMVLDTLGLPAEDVSLIMAVDWFLDRFRTFTNVLGDSLGAGIVHHLSRHELEEMPIEPASGRRESDIELDGPLAGADLEKGESSNGGPSSRNPNVTSAAVEVEWQSTSM
ncbi:excitatory amino acid transporter 3-like isoform X1 [Daphnia pulex]|uniref:excitatory amino acid transporter 3-like isoform X1 n=1 Tax=Daphnia pulex TaxID=6669 RepID=UPI001EE13B96|nr:excitatory amino acid transporter 3-like isoform X1 [Daphnia pulex]